MHIEVEIKIKIENPQALRKKLATIGKRRKIIRQIDHYYVPCHRDFFAHKPHPVEWLRLRTNPDGVRFEYDRSIGARPDGGQAYAEEYETEIGDAEAFRQTLRFLDFRKVVTIDKKRELWDCGEFEICLDRVQGLGDFLEVEAKEVQDAKLDYQSCAKFLESLGFADWRERKIKVGYPVLLLQKQ